MSSAPADRTARSPDVTSAVEPAVDEPENAPNRTPVIASAHRARHELRQHRARRTDKRAGDDQQGVVEHVARCGNSETSERVQQRDHDGHVGTADRQHEQHAEQQRQARTDNQPTARWTPQLPRFRSRPRRGPTSEVTICAPGTRIGRPVMSSCSFANVISEPVKLTLPTIAVNATAIAAAVESTLCRRTIFVEGDQHRGAAADAVEHRDHLRNRRHLHHAGGRYRECSADHDRDDDQRPMTEALVGRP